MERHQHGRANRASNYALLPPMPGILYARQGEEGVVHRGPGGRTGVEADG